MEIQSVRLRAMHAGDLTSLFPAEKREAGAAWLARQARGTLYIAVAEVGGVALGRQCVDFCADVPTGTAYCFALGVLPKWRSRGIGTLINRHSEAVARARGFHALQADVSKGNPRGLAWHERVGYRKVGERVVRWEEADGEHVSDCWTVERRWAKGK